MLADFFQEFFAENDPRLLIGAAAGIGVMVLEIILANKGLIMSKGPKRLARAKALGHVLQGTLVDCWYETKTGESGNTEYVYHGKYSYYVNGVKYIKKVISYHGRPSQTVALYYDDNPSRVYLEEEMTRQSVGGCLVTLIPVVVAVVVAMLLGYEG